MPEFGALGGVGGSESLWTKEEAAKRKLIKKQENNRLTAGLGPNGETFAQLLVQATQSTLGTSGNNCGGI